MPDLLKPRQYFSLTYSVIPDNKIKQVVGNYTETVYEDTDTAESDRISNFYGVPLKAGGTISGSLPIINHSTKSKYPDYFYEDVVYNTDGAYYAHITRTEKVSASYSITITNDKPMKFIDEEGAVSVIAVEGTSYNATGSNLPWDDENWCYFDDDPDVLWAPYCYNDAGGATTTTSEEALETVEIKSVAVDSIINGQVLIDGKYALKLYIEIYIINNSLDAQQGLTGTAASHTMNLVSAFKFSVNYYTAGTRDVEFDYHLDDADYKDYSLTVKGNEYTNANAIYSIEESGETTEIPWAEWISKNILSKYYRGKIFISAKIKMSYLVENNIGIDSELTIKDINNKFISRNIYGKDVACIFKVKNIEYTCNGEEYNTNVILLEDRLEAYQNYIVNSNNVRVVTSSNLKVILYKEEI